METSPEPNPNDPNSSGGANAPPDDAAGSAARAMTGAGDDPAQLTSIHARRALTGSEASLAWIVSRFTPVLIAQASYRLLPAVRKFVDPEDVVNDTWAVVLPRLDRIECRDNRYTPPLLRYLSTTLLNLVNNHTKKHIRDQVRRRGSSASAGATSERPFDDLPAKQAGIVTNVVFREARNTVLQCLESLDDKDREVILMRGIEQQPNKVVAMLLGVSPTLVATRYHRALQRLRQLLPNSIFDELE